MADVLKTVVIFAIFLVLVIGNFRNIKRHRQEKKDAKRKKEIGGFTVMKKMNAEENTGEESDAEKDDADA